MSASLVGSEMCIRDRGARALAGLCAPQCRGGALPSVLGLRPPGTNPYGAQQADRFVIDLPWVGGG
eukprot:681728-Alexandrium_andersonii.AAC.1